jgi:hypothetical protein
MVNSSCPQEIENCAGKACQNGVGIFYSLARDVVRLRSREGKVQPTAENAEIAEIFNPQISQITRITLINCFMTFSAIFAISAVNYYNDSFNLCFWVVAEFDQESKFEVGCCQIAALNRSS